METREAPLKGYKKKPLAISLIAIGFLLIPGLVLIQIALLSGGSREVLGAVLGSAFFLQEWGLCWSAALSVYIVSRWSFLYFLLLSVTVLTQRITRFIENPSLETPVGLLATAFWFSTVAYFLTSSLKAPYLNPKLRWWKRPQRVPLSREAFIRWGEGRLPVTVLNLSVGGAFVRLEEGVARGQRIPQRLGEEFEFAVPGLVTSRARLVWRALPEGPYRYGMGVQFLGLSREKRRELKRALRMK